MFRNHRAVSALNHPTTDPENIVIDSIPVPPPSKTVRRVAGLLRELYVLRDAGCSPSQMGEAMGYMACVVAMLSPDEWRDAVALADGGE